MTREQEEYVHSFILAQFLLFIRSEPRRCLNSVFLQEGRDRSVYDSLEAAAGVPLYRYLGLSSIFRLNN